MENQYALAHLTVMGCSPPEMTRLAARVGYDFVGFRLIPMGIPGESAYFPDDKEMIRQTKAALDDTGMKVLDLELARILADKSPKDYAPAIEVAAELGARSVISSAWTTDRTDRNFVVERYAEICEIAKPFGLTVELEFPSFSRLTNLQEAADIVRAANCENCGILVDTLYVHFSRIDLDELDAVPREWFHLLHICDSLPEIPTTREGMIHVARDERLYLGEGCIDFAAIFERLPQVPYSIELPNLKRVDEYGYEEHARRCLESAKHYVETHTAPEIRYRKQA